MLGSSGPTELVWNFPNGRASVWKRHAVPASACNLAFAQVLARVDVNGMLNGRAPGTPEVMYCLVPIPSEDN